MYDVNMDAIRGQAQQAGREAGTFYRFPRDKNVFFYLLPPWSDRGLVAREMWECFGLPNRARWTAWRSWDYRSPGIGDQDPVVNEMLRLKQEGFLKVEEMLPSSRYYANALIVGEQDPTTSTWEAKEPSVSILALPSTVYNEICKLWSQPGYETLAHPKGAILITVIKTGQGMQTRYSTTVHQQIGPQGYQPVREDLFQRYGQDTMVEILKGIKDLDNSGPFFRPPGDDVKVKGQGIVRDLRAKFSGASTLPPGAVAGPGSQVSMGGPPVAFGRGAVGPGPIAPPVTGIAPGPAPSVPPAYSSPPTDGKSCGPPGAQIPMGPKSPAVDSNRGAVGHPVPPGVNFPPSVVVMPPAPPTLLPVNPQ